MRAVFMGTPEFAVPTLEALVKAGHEVVAVYTQPDRPKGRGQQLVSPPVKDAAQRLRLPVFQPERIRRPENVEALQASRPDVIVVVGYGQIIPQNIIDIPRSGILNVHASLLPKYRGAAPIQWAIANGESETGITIMQIDAGLDTGDMLSRWKTIVNPDETAPELAARLAPRGAELLIRTLEDVHAGRAVRVKQNDAEATHAPILKKEDGQVLWTRTAQEIYNRLRGFTPWPGAYTSLRGQQLQILRARVSDTKVPGPPGTIHVEGRRLFVQCGSESALELSEIQLQGKKRMAVDAFLNGYAMHQHEKLGEQQ
jgi:methionyl-tRNA formyltransferase